MRKPLIVLAAAAAAFAVPASAQSFLGTWTATATTPGGEVTEELTVVEDGEGHAVTGKLLGASAGGPEGSPGYEVELEGDSFSYKRAVTIPGSELEIAYSGTVEGDTFTGTATFEGFDAVPYNGVRKQEGE
jgi:hypothetical protein